MYMGNTGVHVYQCEILLNIGEQSSIEINYGLQDEPCDLGLQCEPGPGTAVLPDAVVVSSFCSSLVEFMTVKC